jgi:hypothetical protein
LRARITLPGERDWYAISGPGLLDSIRIVTNVRNTVGDDGIAVNPPTCPGPTPLLVSLYSVEGHLMRTVRVPAEEGRDAVLEGPELPGRYVLAVRAADSGCAGLLYTIGTQQSQKVSRELHESGTVSRARPPGKPPTLRPPFPRKQAAQGNGRRANPGRTVLVDCSHELARRRRSSRRSSGAWRSSFTTRRDRGAGIG